MVTHAQLIQRCSRTLLIVALALVATTARAEGPLRWKFKEGDALNYVLNRVAEGKLDLQGSEIVFKMSMTFDVTWKVKSASADGAADVDQTVDRVQIYMSSPLGGDLVYDSQNPGKIGGPVWAQMSPMIEAMVGQTFPLTISPLGRVSDVKIPDKLAEVFKKQSANPNRQAGFGIGGGFSERGIKELIEKSVLPLPEGQGNEVTWTQHFEEPLPQMGTKMTDVTFSFAGPEKLDGKDAMKVTALSEMTFEAADAPLADVEITEQEGTATFYFDPAAGRMLKADGVQTFIMEVTGAREITQTMKETMSMRAGKSPAAAPPEKDAKAPASN
jgi:hypothetical protein